MKLINIHGAPGVGKTTLCERLYSEMKNKGMSVGMAKEYAKECLERGEDYKLRDQFTVFTGQVSNIEEQISQGHDIVLVDTPPICQIIYFAYSDQWMSQQTFQRLATEYHHKYESIDYLLHHDSPPAERQNDQREGLDHKEISRSLLHLFNELHIPHKSILRKNALNTVLSDILPNSSIQPSKSNYR